MKERADQRNIGVMSRWMGMMIAALCAACGGGGPGPLPGTPVAPTIASQPTGAAVNDGASATFTVVAAGTAPLAYQWRREGVNLTDGAGVSGATATTLTVAAPYALNGSRYTVQVSNAAGSVVSANALLTVLPVAPTITNQPSSLTVIAGQSAAFAVVVTGGTAPVTFQWKRGGIAVGGATSASYTLAPTTIADNGASFTVEIANPVGTLLSATATLTVTAPTKSWSAPVRISSNAAATEVHWPRVGIDASGNATALWREVIVSGAGASYGVMSARFDSASSWTAPMRIDRNTTENSWLPDLAVTSSGLAVASIQQEFANTIGIYSAFETRYTAGAWTAPVPIENVVNYQVDHERIAAHSSGVAVAAWSQSDGVRSRVYANRSDTAGVWPANAVIIDTGETSVFPHVAMGANGHAVATWSQQSANGAYHIFGARNTGAGWVGSQALETETVAAIPESYAAANAVGDAMVVWVQPNAVTGRRVVRASRWVAAAGTWTAPVPVSDGVRDVSQPRIAVDGDGFIAAWVESASVSGIRVARYSLTAAAWSAPLPVQPATDITGSSIQVAADTAGNAVVSWLQPKALSSLIADVYASHSTATGWSAPLKLTADAEGYGELSSYTVPQLSINALGQAVLVWHERKDSPGTQGIWARVYR